MSCPTCDHTMHALGCKVSGDTFFYCPRCGTILPCTGEVVVPALIDRLRAFAKAWAIDACHEMYDDWTRLGIRESINTPEARKQ